MQTQPLMRGISVGEAESRNNTTVIAIDDPCKSQHLPGLFVFSCCYVGAALKAAVVNCRACGARMLFNIIGGFHAQTSRRGSGMRKAGNRCHLATCADMKMEYAAAQIEH